MTVWTPNKTAVVLAVALAGALSAAAARLLATSQSTQPAHAEDARVIREPDALGEATPVSAISVEAAAKLKEVFAAHRGFAAGVSQEIMTSSGLVEPDHTGTISGAPAPTAPFPGHSFETSVFRMSRAEIDRMVAKGEEVLKTSDLATARLYFRRAAEAGDVRGALGMAQTFDSKVLQELRLFGIRADAPEAARWYARARELGHSGPVHSAPLGTRRSEARISP